MRPQRTSSLTSLALATDASSSALKELIAACHEGDNVKRWERLGKILDADLFASYHAMEAILCHWDGYSFNRNNYRFYLDPDSRKFSFFLHGMKKAASPRPWSTSTWS